jgi:hypothetical protein
VKIERAESKFEPVVITLESQEEVEVLRGLTGKVEGLGATRNITDKIYYGSEPFSKDCKEFFKNNISVR